MSLQIFLLIANYSFARLNKLYMKYPIGIVGYGYVGQAVEYGFKKEPIYIYDPYKNHKDWQTLCEKSKFIFVCVPTPTLDDYSGIDLSIVEYVVGEIADKIKGTDKIIVIKSTVIPGTTQQLINKYKGVNICFNPEFLTEKNYKKDFVETDRIIIGAKDKKRGKELEQLYRKYFPKTPIYITDPTSAEMVKYMANTYLAMKVLFGYEMYELCGKLGINYDKVKEMVTADKRIENTHLNVSSSTTANSNTTNRKGFGGKCFPKDIVALIGLGKSLKVDMELLETVWRKNQRIRKVHDWLEIPFVVTKKKSV